MKTFDFFFHNHEAETEMVKRSAVSPGTGTYPLSIHDP